MTRTAALFLCAAPAGLLLAGCATPLPTGPSVLAVPGKDKTFAQFQQDEYSCRNYAQSQIGAVSPSQAATGSTVGGAAIGTVAGAAAGALIGAAAGNAGVGAAIGAGSGLALGTSVGASNGAYAGADLQRRYDFAYIQCMTANGQDVQASNGPPVGFPAYGYSGGYPAYAYDDPTVVVGGPVIGLGFGYGGFGYGGWGHRHGGYGYGGYGGGWNHGGGGRYWRH